MDARETRMPPDGAPRPFQVVAKPNGPQCNLNCSYCYYLSKHALYPATRKFCMEGAVLETYIHDYIASQAALGLREIFFNWQGGEPTVLGLPYFRNIVALQSACTPPGVVVRNTIQTNGTLLDAAWATFLRENAFLVGLSIDGPAALHDGYRQDRAGRPTHAKVMAAAALLRAHGVEFNTLTCIHPHNAGAGREVYRFLKSIGSTYLQFIPLVGRDDTTGELAPWSVSAEGYGAFLCDVFDEWIARDVGRIFVQFFDVQLGLWLGAPSGLCSYAPTCGDGLAIEHNGDLYACDHYVDAEHKLGNILHTPIAALAGRPEQRRFGAAKRDGLPRACRICAFRFACNGGCPKHRFITTAEGEPGLNYFCPAHLRFFRHAGPALRRMVELVRAGRSPADIMTHSPRTQHDRTPPITTGERDGQPS